MSSLDSVDVSKSKEELAAEYSQVDSVAVSKSKEELAAEAALAAETKIAKLITKFGQQETATDAFNVFSDLLKIDKAGYIWKKIYDDLCSNQATLTIKYKADHVKYGEMAQNLFKMIKLDGGFLNELKSQNEYNNPRSTDEIQHRVNSFFQFVMDSVGTNGFCVCQEENYSSLDKWVFGGINHAKLKAKNIGFIRAIKVKKDGNPSQSADQGMFKDLGIPNGQYQQIEDGIPDKAIQMLGDGVALYYDAKAWTLTAAQCSSGAGYTEKKYIEASSSLDSITAEPSLDPFIVAKFIFNAASSDQAAAASVVPEQTELIVATTHLESGDIHLKTGDKDTLRQTSVEKLNKVIETMSNGGKISVIIGMDGNSSAYTMHTLVVDELNGIYKTAIDGHDPEAIKESGTISIPDMPVSSVKQRGKKTNQPYKSEPIVALIDYLVYKGLDLELATAAKLPKIPHSYKMDDFIKEYGLPSDWLNYVVPNGDWSDINQWHNWASDHLPVRAIFILNGKKFPFTTANVLSSTLSNDGFLVGKRWADILKTQPLDTQGYVISKILSSEYSGFFNEAQINQLISLGFDIHRRATGEYGTLSGLEMGGFKLFNAKTVLKSIPSIIDKLIFNVLELMVDMRISVERAIEQVDRDPNVFVHDAVRLYYVLPDDSKDLKSKTAAVLNELQDYSFEEPIKDGTSSLGRGLIVKMTSPTKYMFEMQFFTQDGKQLYETDGSHDIYKDIQRICAHLRHHILTDDKQRAERTYEELQLLFDKAEKLLESTKINGLDNLDSGLQYKPSNSICQLKDRIKIEYKDFNIKKGGTRRKRRILHKRTIRRKRVTKRRITNNRIKTRLKSTVKC